MWGKAEIIPTWQPVPTKSLAVGPQSSKASYQPNLVPQLPVRSGNHVYHHLHLYPGTYSQPLNSSLLWLAGVNLCGLQPGTLMKR